MIFIRTLQNVMDHFGCDADAARCYMDFREEGYSREQSALMAGLADPSYVETEPDAAQESE